MTKYDKTIYKNIIEKAAIAIGVHPNYVKSCLEKTLAAFNNTTTNNSSVLSAVLTNEPPFQFLIDNPAFLICQDDEFKEAREHGEPVGNLDYLGKTFSCYLYKGHYYIENTEKS